MSDERNVPLTLDEARQLVELAQKHDGFGHVMLKIERGKIVRATMEYNLLPDDVRKMLRA